MPITLRSSVIILASFPTSPTLVFLWLNDTLHESMLCAFSLSSGKLQFFCCSLSPPTSCNSLALSLFFCSTSNSHVFVLSRVLRVLCNYFCKFSTVLTRLTSLVRQFRRFLASQTIFVLASCAFSAFQWCVLLLTGGAGSIFDSRTEIFVQYQLPPTRIFMLRLRVALYPHI